MGHAVCVTPPAVTSTLAPYPSGANDGSPLEDQIPALIEEHGLFERLAAWHEGGAEAVRYRFEVRGPGLEHPRRRALVRAWVERLEKADAPLRNSASHYDVELRVERANVNVAPDKLGSFRVLVSVPAGALTDESVPIIFTVMDVRGPDTARHNSIFRGPAAK